MSPSEPKWRWYILGPETRNGEPWIQRLEEVDRVPPSIWPIEISLPRLVIRISPKGRTPKREEMQFFIREDLVDE